MNVSSFSAEQSLKLMHNISCYQRVFAADIDVNDTVSNLTIEGRIFKPRTNGVNEGNSHLHIAIIIPATLIVSLFAVIVVVVVLVIGHIKIRRTKLQNNHSENLSPQDKSDSSDQHLPSDVKDSGKSPPLNKLPKSLTHDQHETSYNSPSHNTISVQLTEDSAEDIKQLVENVKKTSDATDTSQDVPVYAVPDKTKRKHKVQSNENCDGVEEKENEEEHIYYVLEKDQVPKEVEETLPDLQAPELPPPFGCSSSGVNEFPVYQDICEISMKTVNNDVNSNQLCQTQTGSKSQSNQCVRTSCAEPNQGAVYSTPERSKVSS